MRSFFWRTGLVIFLFAGEVFLNTLTGYSGVIPEILFFVCVSWVFILPFKKMLGLVVPLLLFFDVLRDGAFGSFFFFGFLLVATAAFFASRVERGNVISSGSFFYSFLIIFFSLGLFWYQSGSVLPFGIMVAHSVLVFVFFPLIFLLVAKLERILDTSFREAARKIR